MAKRVLSVAASLLILAACSAEPTQPDMRSPVLAGAAFIEPGQAGQQLFNSAFIDALGEYCEASYETPNGSNSAVSSRFLPAGAIKVVMNKNQVKATCKFLDTSGSYDGNAETGPVENCTLQTADGDWYYGGTGHLTSANNVVDEVEGLPFGTGGQTTLQCTFDVP